MIIRSGGGRYSVLFTAAVLIVWALLMAAGTVAGAWKIVLISVLACAAMAGGAAATAGLPLAPRWRGWSDGIAAGAMITSACLFLLPEAIHGGAGSGGLGVAIGLLTGAGLDALARGATPKNTPRFESSLAALTLHSLGDGFVTGLAYAHLPALGLMLGTIIIAHKLPAGYASARNLQRHAMARHPVIWPACAMGLACVPTGLLVAPGALGQDNVLVGLATGIFMYVGIEFLAPAFAAEQHPGVWEPIAATALGTVAVILLKHAIH